MDNIIISSYNKNKYDSTVREQNNIYHWKSNQMLNDILNLRKYIFRIMENRKYENTGIIYHAPQFTHTNSNLIYSFYHYHFKNGGFDSIYNPTIFLILLK